MNAAHFHLLVNHIPIIFPITGAIVLVTGLIVKSEPIKRTSYLLFIIGGISTMAAMYTGEGAQELLERMLVADEDYMQKHKAASRQFSFASYALGWLSALGLWASMKQKSFTKFVEIGILVAFIFAVFLGRAAGTTGGEIRHTEIRTTTDGSNPVFNENSSDEENED